MAKPDKPQRKPKKRRRSRATNPLPKGSVPLPGGKLLLPPLKGQTELQIRAVDHQKPDYKKLFLVALEVAKKIEKERQAEAAQDETDSDKSEAA